VSDLLPRLVWRELAASLLGGGAGALLFAALFARRQTLLARLARHEASLAAELAFLRAPLSAARLVKLELLVASVGLVCALLSAWLPTSLALLVLLSVRPVLQARRLSRTTALEAQLDGWLLALASGLRAAPALGEAIEQTIPLVAAPLRDELVLLVNEVHLGTPLDAALARAATRLRSRTFQTAISALRIGRNTGGELPAILERSAATLREMARLEGVLRTRTAEGRAQAFVLAALPLPLVGLLHYLSPGFLEPLLTSTRGHLVIAGSVVLWGASIALARVILDVDL
jgi:tight adherence protein B